MIKIQTNILTRLLYSIEDGDPYYPNVKMDLWIAKNRQGAHFINFLSFLTRALRYLGFNKQTI